MAFPQYGGYPYNSFPSYPPPASFPQASAQQSPAQGLSPASRPVTNKEEANAVSADFSGALMVFPDITHNRVYVKRWDYQSGSAVFLEYVPKGDPGKQESAPLFATQDDLRTVNENIAAIRVEIEDLKKGRKKNESDGE